MSRPVAVAIHDVEPRTFERCERIREWLYDRGVERATLLVIPAADLHAFHRRSPALADWLSRQAAAGDAVAQHGLQHRTTRRQGARRRWQGGMAAEFAGLHGDATERALDTGRSIMRAAGIEPLGFVAPGYAYTGRLRHALEERFSWWAGLLGLHAPGVPARLSPACCLGTSSAVKRALSPTVVRALAHAPGELLRVDVHPADFDLPRHVKALERLVDGRDCITYDEAVAG
jgi:predicted deacetylase